MPSGTQTFQPHGGSKPQPRPYSQRVVAAPRADFLDETIAIWQPRAKRTLTREDAREIIENVTGFFAVLREWDRAERKARASQSEDGAA